MIKRIISFTVAVIMLMSIPVSSQQVEKTTLAKFLEINADNAKFITLTSKDGEIVAVDANMFHSIADSIVLTLQTDIKPVGMDGVYISVEKTDGTFGYAYITNNGEVDEYSQFVSRIPFVMYIAEDKETLGKLFALVPDHTNGALKVSNWAQENLIEAQGKNIIPESFNGISDYTQNITREQFCELAFTMFEKTGVHFNYGTQVEPFEDTNNMAVKQLYLYGIVSGKGENIFAPNDLLTREESATILYRLYKCMEMQGIDYMTTSFRFYDDDKISEWAKDSIYNMYNKGIMTGTENGMFAPQDNYTLEQGIVTMLRLYNLIQDEDTDQQGISSFMELKKYDVLVHDNDVLHNRADVQEERLRPVTLKFADKDDVPIITNADVETDCVVGKDSMDQYYNLELMLTDRGREKFAEATERVAKYENGDNYIAIYVNDDLISRPFIMDKIDSDKVIISGTFTFETAQEFADIINESLK